MITHVNGFVSTFWLLPTNRDETTWLANWLFQLCRRYAVHCQLSEAHFIIVWCWLLLCFMAWHSLVFTFKKVFLFFKSQVSCGFRLFYVFNSDMLMYEPSEPYLRFAWKNISLFVMVLLVGTLNFAVRQNILHVTEIHVCRSADMCDSQHRAATPRTCAVCLYDHSKVADHRSKLQCCWRASICPSPCA